MGGFALRLLRWLGHDELTPLLLVVLSAGGLWFFAVLANSVEDPATPSFDRAVLLAMRNPTDPFDPLGPRWFEEVMRDCTAFGGVTWLAILSLGAIGYLALRRQIGMLWLVVVAVTGSWTLSMSLKWLFDRPRPDLISHGSHFYTASFPSGHSLMAAATYLTLAALMGRVQTQRRLKVYLFCWALMLTLLTGISRVYLGVHWPTDVLAGWTLGATWAILCWLVARGLQKQGPSQTTQ